MITEEQLDILNEAKEVSEELRLKLSKIKIRINGAKSPAVISAISSLFGQSHVLGSGDAYITYDMYCSVVDLIRELGELTAQESIK